MKFWDSSAIVPLILEEPRSSRMEEALSDDDAMTVWWGTVVECAAAVERAGRERQVPHATVRAALETTRTLARKWSEVPPLDDLREQAIRLARIHALRAGDAFQLAAALVASEYRPKELPFVTLDARLAGAADLEGFPVIS